MCYVHRSLWECVFACSCISPIPFGPASQSARSVTCVCFMTCHCKVKYLRVLAASDGGDDSWPLIWRRGRYVGTETATNTHTHRHKRNRVSLTQRSPFFRIERKIYAVKWLQNGCVWNLLSISFIVLFFCQTFILVFSIISVTKFLIIFQIITYECSTSTSL